MSGNQLRHFEVVITLIGIFTFFRFFLGLLDYFFSQVRPKRLLLFVLYVIIAVRKITAHHLVKVIVLMLVIRMVEVIVFVLGLSLFGVKNLCEFPKVSLKLFFVFVVH
jgi:hypothetical protein